ncbi:MAG: hypothetical protein JSV19_11700 [Phycisphaerales bacterium]|nr:MAG: hypothetical protein JSV19_11700 [Phycisphaerales bacterium]
MNHYRNTIFAVPVVWFVAAAALADDYVTYLGAIDVNEPLGRIVADPVRPKVYGITGDGDVVFINRNTWSVENVVSTGRILRDIDIHPSNNSLTVLDNVTGEYWNQPPAVYVVEFDLGSQSPTGIVLAQAPLYQMAHGRPNRIVGVQTNQWVDVYQLDATTGALLSSDWGGYYGGTDWQGPNLFVTNSSGTRLYRTEIGISTIELIVFDTSTDVIAEIDSRDVGSYGNEPVFLNSTDTSLYVGDIRLDPDNIDNILGMFPEHILAGTGDDSLCFGTGGVYDPVWGSKLQDMPVGYDMMSLGENDRYLYTFDQSSQRLHVMSVIPEPAMLTLLGLGGLLLIRRSR